MKEQILFDVIDDPQGGGFKYEPGRGESEETGVLRMNSGKSFPVYRGIPVLLDSQALENGQARDALKEDIKKYFRDMWNERSEKGVRFWQDDGYSYGVCLAEAIKHCGDVSGKKALLLGAGRGHEAAAFQQLGATTLTTDILYDGLLTKGLSGARAAMDAEKLYIADNRMDVVSASPSLRNHCLFGVHVLRK